MPPHERSSSSTGTIKAEPPLDKTVAPIENTLHLTPLFEIGPNIFTNTRKLWQPVGARGIYGGSVISQSLLAAQLTVPSTFVPHSMHCYFVLSGNPHIPILYHVDIVREGRSFHTRTVQARQRGKAIFTMTCSFTVPQATKIAESDNPEKRIVRHQPVFPTADIRLPEECESESDVIARLLKTGRIDEDMAAEGMKRFERDPFEWRAIGVGQRNPKAKILHPASTSHPDPSLPPAEKVMRQWVRSKAPISDPLYVNPALAYFSDSWFIGTVGRVNSAARRDRVGMMVSLDHTIHFHAGDRTKVDEWLLVETECPWADEERTLVRMRVWSADGTLLASCLQEGMVRLKDGREGEGMEDASSPGAHTPKANL
ncbi:thioesterase-like superfamily-domain-containing protein [Tricharina praecox]|uniref:thioesterase-like superfamily-domain-containing protein n=1 Tax=Tricharina praecox TaxID=43433 RepID=UPI002220EF49|nr:thioesterase-like superfamily-domain-containing protein [Tricharina praecox]KAI5848916.1 thioesterase-like superfamily-domain-containing protein [Tricharina praecox]